MSKKVKKKKYKLLLLVSLIVVIICIIVCFCMYNHLVSPVGDGKISYDVLIPKGATIQSISEILLYHGLIRNEFAFKLYSKLNNLEDGIKHGKFKLNNGMSVEDILKTLITGKGEDERLEILITEGMNIYDIANIFENQDICSKEAFLQLCNDKNLLAKFNVDSISLEGYLLPKKYYYKKENQPEDIIKRIIDTLYKYFPPDDDLIIERLKKINISYNQMLILASFVEEEAKVDSERELIASVFINRYRKGMLFQCDPTIIYALIKDGVWEKREKNDRKLSRVKGDMDYDSLYNTYLYKGFPPTPISNPGEKSIQAVLKAPDTKYLYFVLKDDKTHAFASSAKEHQENVRNYRRMVYSKKNN